MNTHKASCPSDISRSSRIALAIGMAWGLALGPAPAWADRLELSDIAAGHGGFVIDGEASPADSLASAGDVNGDGLADVIVGAPFSAGGAGRAYVIFGKTGTTAVHLSDVANGAGGFVIQGTTATPAGASVAGIGDVNGDGLADLLVEATGTARHGTIGRSYVVFGKTDTGAVALADLELGGGGGFVIHHALKSGGPVPVAAAGDVNGDGLGDLLIARPVEAAYHRDGKAYVVFGKTSSAPVELSAIEGGEGGFVIDGHENAGNVVAGVGDVNGDGLADVAVASRWGGPPHTRKGRVYVVFGKTDGTAVDTDSLDNGEGGGFAIHGAIHDDYSGTSVAGAGDVNGDGLADVIVGSPGLDLDGGAHVVFGRTSAKVVELSDVADGVGGFLIRGGDGAGPGTVVAGAGDINADGLGDVMLATAYGLHPAEYVVYGQTGTGTLYVTAIASGIGGFEIHPEFEATDSLLRGAGDVNGDGLADLLVANPHYGETYVIFGATTGAFADTQVDQLGGTGDDTLTGNTKSNVFVGGAGDDTFVGNGGADVLYGGAGDDVFLLKSSNVKALFSKFGMNGNTEHLARLDGGVGFDTLRLVGGGINLDLVKTANQGAGGNESTSRIESIERIDLTGTGDNTLSIGVRDVQDMAAMNLINSGNEAALGWTDGTYAFPSKVGRHQLVVDGNAGDVVNLGPAANGWENAGTVFTGGLRYDVYNTNTKPAPTFERVQVIVAHAVTINVAPPGGANAGAGRR